MSLQLARSLELSAQVPGIDWLHRDIQTHKASPVRLVHSTGRLGSVYA